MSEYTPGPWKVHTRPYGYDIQGPPQALNRCQFEKLEDAERIVACVNACEGINPEAVPDLVRACQSLFDADHYDHFAARMSDSEMAAIEAMRAALAKAKGE